MSKPLDTIDLTLSMSKEESLARVLRAQRHLTHLRLFTAGLLEPKKVGPSILVLFEGFDAAGKGGAIRRITAALDPRHVRVVPIGPPSSDELQHHFLWRFQSALPARGGMTIFDRSWYGRLLVERVEGLIDHDTCDRSATEIVEFERALVNDGNIVVKFWLQISEQEQLRRFLERQNDPLKQWKLTPDDWENRSHRDKYVDAINNAINATDHEHARWKLVAAENKHFARVFVLETLNEQIEKGLAQLGFEVPVSRGDDYLDKA
jgi:polyphosphate kinase 2 (PPK2 family)